MLSHLFEMVEEHYYWVTYIWAKNATFGKPVIAVLSSGKMSKSSKVKVSLSDRKEEEEGPAPTSG